MAQTDMNAHISAPSGPSLTEKEDAVVSVNMNLSDFAMKACATPL